MEYACLFLLGVGTQVVSDIVFANVVVVPTHSLVWGESDHPAFGPPTSLSLHLASSSITPAGSVHKSRGECGAYVGAVEEMVCVVCVVVAEGA